MEKYVSQGGVWVKESDCQTQTAAPTSPTAEVKLVTEKPAEPKSSTPAAAKPKGKKGRPKGSKNSKSKK